METLCGILLKRLFLLVYMQYFPIPSDRLVHGQNNGQSSLGLLKG